MIRAACLAFALTLVLGACGGDGEGDPASAAIAGRESPSLLARVMGKSDALPPGFNALPQGPWTELADALVQSRDLRAAVGTTREVLARGGVGTWDGSTMLVVPVGTPASFAATPMETVHMAMEARRKGSMARMDMAEFAQMLEAFGWPFEDANPRAKADKPLLAGVAEEDGEAWRTATAAAIDATRAAQEADRAAREAAAQAERERIMGPVQARRDAIRAEQEEANALLAATPRGQQDRRDALRERIEVANQAARAQRDEYDAARRQWQQASEVRSARDKAVLDLQWAEREVEARVGPDYQAGAEMMALLADWVQEAMAHPEDPRSFTPLFLAEMARRQDAPVDLSGGHRVSPLEDYEDQPHAASGPRSTQLRWTLLEMELFVAALHRNGAAPAASAFRGEGAAGRLAGWLLPAAHAATPCSDIKDAAGGGWGEAQTIAAGEAGGFLSGGVFGKYFGEAGGNAVGNAMSATNTVGKIIKLAAFYQHEQVTVEVDQPLVHKPIDYWKRVTFTAKAGVDPEDLEAYEELSEKMSGADQALRDCLGWAGFPSTSTIAEVAKDAENWRIDWSLRGGHSPHVEWSPRDNDLDFSGGRQTTNLKRTSPSSAEAKFVIRVKDERRHEGPQRKVQAWVRASVDASGGPPFGSLVSAVKGVFGVADALTEVATGWILVAFKPKAYASVDIEFHCYDPTTIHHYVGDPVAWGNGGEAENKDCTFEFNSREEYEDWRDRQG